NTIRFSSSSTPPPALPFLERSPDLPPSGRLGGEAESVGKPGPYFRAVVLVPLALALLAGAPAPAEASPACRVDPALSEAALELLLAQPPRLSPGALRAAARRTGSQVPHLRARVFRAGERVRPWLRELAAEAEAPLVCGEADDGQRRLWLVGELGGALTPLDPEARALEVRVAP